MKIPPLPKYRAHRKLQEARSRTCPHLTLSFVGLLLIAGCAVTYEATTGFRGVLGCINFTGPGFSLSCPEGPLRQPAIPNTPQPAP